MSDRVKVVEAPLFKSYLSIEIEEKKRGVHLPGAARCLFWLQRPAVVEMKKSLLSKNGMRSTTIRTLTSLISSPEIAYVLLPANSLVKRLFFWTVLIRRPSFSSKIWGFNSSYRSRTTIYLRRKKQAQSRQC